MSEDKSVARLSEAEWRERLTPEEFQVMRQKGTERPYTGEYWNSHDDGSYVCRGCGEPLFDALAKFDSGCGWPSFFQPASDDVIAEHRDVSHGMIRTEIVCKACGAHLGHVFSDGPQPTGLRYCVNSLSLRHKPRQP